MRSWRLGLANLGPGVVEELQFVVTADEFRRGAIQDAGNVDPEFGVLDWRNLGDQLAESAFVSEEIVEVVTRLHVLTMGVLQHCDLRVLCRFRGFWSIANRRVL